MANNRQRARLGIGEAVAKAGDTSVEQVFGFLWHAVGVYRPLVPPDIGQVVEIQLGKIGAQMCGAAAHIAAMRQMFDRAGGNGDGRDPVKDDLGGLDRTGERRTNDVLYAKACRLCACRQCLLPTQLGERRVKDHRIGVAIVMGSVEFGLAVADEVDRHLGFQIYGRGTRKR